MKFSIIASLMISLTSFILKENAFSTNKKNKPKVMKYNKKKNETAFNCLSYL